MKPTPTQFIAATVIVVLVITAWYLVDAATFWAIFILIFADKLGSDRDLWRLLGKKKRRPISENEEKVEIINRIPRRAQQ